MVVGGIIFILCGLLFVLAPQKIMRFLTRSYKDYCKIYPFFPRNEKQYEARSSFIIFFGIILIISGVSIIVIGFILY
jgi:hypothetical protein